MTAAEALLEAARRGLTLRPRGEALDVFPARLCDPALAARLRLHKTTLMALLRMRFLVVRSGALNETVLFAEDERTREALIAAGAEPGSIYTREELRALVDAGPIVPAGLLLIHTAKRLFAGRIVKE